MYKNIEIADVIGSAFFYGRTKTQFTFEEIEIVFTEIRQKDQFISIENKNRSLRHIMDLIEVDNIEVDRTIVLPKNKAIQDALNVSSIVLISKRGICFLKSLKAFLNYERKEIFRHSTWVYLGS